MKEEARQYSLFSIIIAMIYNMPTIILSGVSLLGANKAETKNKYRLANILRVLSVVIGIAGATALIFVAVKASH